MLRFKVPFLHTTGGTFFRPRGAGGAYGAFHKKGAFASRGDRTHDHAVKSRALYLLS